MTDNLTCPYCGHSVHSHSEYACTINHCTCRISREDAVAYGINERLRSLAEGQSKLYHEIDMLRVSVAVLESKLERLINALKTGIDGENE